MTDNDQVLTKEWLEQKLAADREAEEQARQEEAEEKAREDMRAAWKQETGVEPTNAELELALKEKRHKDVAEAARYNDAVARRQMHQLF